MLRENGDSARDILDSIVSPGLNKRMKTRHFTLAHKMLADASSGTGQGIVAIFRCRGEERLEVGCFLVDSYCLGVKDAWHKVIDKADLPELKQRIFENDYLEKEGAWGRKLVEGAVDYARQLGFSPHRDYKKAARVFGGIQAENCDEAFVFGKDGKPFYIASENDSDEKINKIIRHLLVRCGEDNFHYLVPLLEDEVIGRVDELLEDAKEGRLDKAEAGLRRLAQKHPDVGVVHYGLGSVAALRGDIKASLPCFNEAVRLDPGLTEAWYNKGISHQKLIEIVPMTRALQKALELAGTDDDYEEIVETARDLIGTVEKVARKEYDLDLETYLEAGTLFDRGFEKMKQGKWAEGLADMRESARINPRSPQTFGNMGTCLLQMGRIREARESLEQALQLDPDYRPAQENLKLLEGVDENNPPPPSLRMKIYNSGRLD